ncbi:hypothetical protein L596_022695 [Steinernema carpocapsae]|uniref:Uncharacterized protein n=1 Tax=Steinernema carpocapsae TaxID=34508 RepID=A0A4U5MMG6_STECR|nr:hypothetical protein L596_022695 [Steinernema carpocapsae]
MDKYACQEYEPTRTFNARHGEWSERLHVGSDIDSKCLSKAEWSEIARKECGAEPLVPSYSGQCGFQGDKYVEMVFLCNQPKKVGLL